MMLNSVFNIHYKPDIILPIAAIRIEVIAANHDSFFGGLICGGLLL